MIRGKIFSNAIRLLGILVHKVSSMPRRKNNKETEILQTEQRILRVEEEILRKVEELEHHPVRLTHSIVIYFKEPHMANNVLVLSVGQSSTGTIVPLLADGVTPSGGTVSAASFTIPPDPSFSATDNTDGTVTITGVAPSSAPITGTATATVTDGDGAVSSFSTSFTVTVNAVTPPPPVATTASIAVSFSTPTP